MQFIKYFYFIFYQNPLDISVISRYKGDILCKVPSKWLSFFFQNDYLENVLKDT